VFVAHDMSALCAPVRVHLPAVGGAHEQTGGVVDAHEAVQVVGRLTDTGGGGSHHPVTVAL